PPSLALYNDETEVTPSPPKKATTAERSAGFVGRDIEDIDYDEDSE
ncbi:unnamed protein product, partial [Linum tenue]